MVFNDLPTSGAQGFTTITTIIDIAPATDGKRGRWEKLPREEAQKTMQTMVNRKVEKLDAVKGILVFLFVLPVIGCVQTARLYDLSSGQVTPAKFSYSGSGRGTISLNLAEGSTCSGEYFTVTDGVTSWGTIFGQVWGPQGALSGLATSVGGSTPNEQRGTAVAVCDGGATVECEYVARGPHGHGACRDNNGKLFKLMF